MTFHAFSNWTLNDPIDDAPVDQIAMGLQAHGLGTPPCFGVFSTADAFIMNIGAFLNRSRGKVLTRDLIVEFVTAPNKSDEHDLTEEQADKVIAVTQMVLTQLDLMDKEFNGPPEMKPEEFLMAGHTPDDPVVKKTQEIVERMHDEALTEENDDAGTSGEESQIG